MSQPFVYVGTWTIKPGKLEEAKKYMAEHADLIETNEPRLIAFHVYFDEDGSTASVVQVHPDSTSMEFHMEVISKHMASAFEIIDTILSEQYYGAMSESLAKTLAEYETPEVTVIKRPVFHAGFTRSNAAR
jgi:quinol monooxygenase YgiN